MTTKQTRLLPILVCILLGTSAPVALCGPIPAKETAPPENDERAVAEATAETGDEYDRLNRLRIQYFTETIAIQKSIVDEATAQQAAKKWRALLPLEIEIKSLDKKLGPPSAERQAELNKEYVARINELTMSLSRLAAKLANQPHYRVLHIAQLQNLADQGAEDAKKALEFMLRETEQKAKEQAQQKQAAGSETDQATEDPDAKAAWRTDVAAFDEYLRKLTAQGRVPEEEALGKRITAKPGGGGLDTEVMPITDGAGGYVDLKPAKDTVQFRVNEALKGKDVQWDLEIAGAFTDYAGKVHLQPKLAARPNAKDKAEAVAFLNNIILKTPKVGRLKAGDRVRLKGTIGDASTNKGIFLTSGPIAIYHLDAAPHTVFWVGLTEATVTRLDRDDSPPSGEAKEGPPE